jgi:hypothetical protein
VDRTATGRTRLAVLDGGVEIWIIGRVELLPRLNDNGCFVNESRLPLISCLTLHTLAQLLATYAGITLIIGPFRAISSDAGIIVTQLKNQVHLILEEEVVQLN